MNACEKAQALLFEEADGRTGPAVRAELDAHLAVCPHCKQVFATWADAVPRLRSLPIDEPSAVSVRRMENEVLRGLQVPALRRPRRSLWLALAAGMLLVAGGGALALRSAVPRPLARIQTLWGRVTLSGAAMSPGAAMAAGGVLEISDEGEAAFIVGREAAVRLFGPGRVTLAGTAQTSQLRLDGGRLAVQLTHRQADESFVVSTRDGHVEVRGTRFVVGYTAHGSYVHVDEGEVAAFRAGVAAPFPVKAGQTFQLASEPVVAPPPAPAEDPAVDVRPRQCTALRCGTTAAQARRAMRGGSPARAIDLVDAALGQSADCPTEARCLDELGYLRAEALRQAGRLETAIAAYRSLNRPGATRAMRQNALYAAALLERRLGRAVDARQSFERAFAANPDGALAEEALVGLLDIAPPRSSDARAAAEQYLKRYPRGHAAARARRVLSDTSSAP